MLCALIVDCDQCMRSVGSSKQVGPNNARTIAYIAGGAQRSILITILPMKLAFCM